MENYKVYIHVFPNGKMYVGITKQDPEARWQKGNGYIKNEYMHRAIVKYGWDNIKHQILIDGLTKEQACESEKQLIKKLRTSEKEFGYNILEGGQNPKITAEMREKLSKYHSGKKASKETKEKMRESRLAFLKNNPNYAELNRKNLDKAIKEAAKSHSKKIVQFDMEWNKIAVWESMREAERCLGIQHAHISKCCKHIPKYNSAGGYRWEYYADIE